MNRRSFIRQTSLLSGALYAIPFWKYSSTPPENRLTMSTVNFRERFAQTWTADGKLKFGSELKLQQIPEYFRERFDLCLVELWSKHFESLDSSYIKELKSALKKAKCGLVNIQFDENYQLGSPDEKVRQASMELALKWIDAAHELGSGAIRINPGRGSKDLFIAAMNILKKEVHKKGMVLMVENHFGMEMDPEVHLDIVKSLGEKVYTLPDFGNYNDDTRYTNLMKIMPHAYQVSAKTMVFDKEMNHLSFDFDRCMQICVDSGFKGVYSVEQWNQGQIVVSEEAMADWMLSKVKKYTN